MNHLAEHHPWCRNFPGTRSQVGEARRFVTGYLADHPDAGTAELVISELATNAVRHSHSGQAGGLFGVTVHAGGGLLLLAVLDEGGPTSPCIQPPDDVRPTGRGLLLVDELTTRWGVDGDECGRTVWALLPLAQRTPVA